MPSATNPIRPGSVRRALDALLWLVIALAVSAVWTGLADAGTNEGGMLVIHIDESIEYSRDTSPRCDPDLRDCAQVVTSIAPNPDRIVILYLMAAFPFGLPRVAGVTLGIDYSTSIVARGNCGVTFEQPDPNWPDSGTGTALVFDPPIDDRLFPLYWFAVYAEYGGSFAVIEHPAQGGAFGDDSIPSVIDEVEGFGWAGFGLTGYNPCLEGIPIGACCLGNGGCIVTTETACEIQDGTYRGDDIPCDAYACVGPCCLDNECYETTALDCARDGAEWGERPGGACGQISCLREKVSWGVLKKTYRDDF
ncbi:MAG: hypothetical protein R3E12_01135 [Candidatus Eisenbacteria bacterium]